MIKLYDNKAEDLTFDYISELCISKNKIVSLETCWLEYNKIFGLFRTPSVKKERFTEIYNDVVNAIKKLV